jgi:hypothetical protein
LEEIVDYGKYFDTRHKPLAPGGYFLLEAASNFCQQGKAVQPGNLKHENKNTE